MQLSANFSLAEATASATARAVGTDNQPTQKAGACLLVGLRP